MELVREQHALCRWPLLLLPVYCLEFDKHMTLQLRHGQPYLFLSQTWTTIWTALKRLDWLAGKMHGSLFVRQGVT